MVEFSVLDLAPIVEGGTAAQALANSRDLARWAETLGYKRYWLAEHHNMPGIASSATAVVIAHVAAGTSKIRVGAGGIMLPNHSPLVVAEQFGTLDALFPGRIDLALGRAPGSDQRTARALRRERMQAADQFPDDLFELLNYLQPQSPQPAVRAIPGEGADIPVWLLGSSLFSAQLAASMGLPYAFAGHFAPAQMVDALQLYRQNFEPSEQLKRPHSMAGVTVVAAETDEEANYHFTSIQQQVVNLHRGTPGRIKPPVKSMDGLWSPAERASVEQFLGEAIVGSPGTVLRRLAAFIQRTQVDEVIVTTQIYDHGARRRSYELLAALVPDLQRQMSGTATVNISAH
jgi:luciferase family oxidoreductase group 1